jgi:predicted amidohydrolase
MPLPMSDQASSECDAEIAPLTIALWAVNLGRPLNGLDAWIADVDAKLGEAAEAGAELLVMPEYACEQWLAFKPEGLALDEEIPWLASLAPAAHERLAEVVPRRRVALLAGTMPWPVDDGHRNRAWLFLPDGRSIAQDKLVLTPSEKNPEGWNLVPGDELVITEWRGLRVATLICLDVEMPALAAKLAPHRPDLVLVPSMTARRSGYARVYGCAKARAVEFLAAVAVTGAVGAALGSSDPAGNVSGCAVYLPCEPELGFHGVHGELPAVDRHDSDGPFLIARDLPMDAIRRLRSEAAEVWPGPWSADHVTIRTGG